MHFVAGRLQKGSKNKIKKTLKHGEMERRAEWESWCSSEARPIQRRNPPSSQINIAGSLLRLLPSPSLFPLLLLLSGFFHYSSVRSESAHSSSPPAARPYPPSRCHRWLDPLILGWSRAVRTPTAMEPQRCPLFSSTKKQPSPSCSICCWGETRVEREGDFFSGRLKNPVRLPLYFCPLDYSSGFV